MSDLTVQMTEQETRKNNFRILVCVDGSDEAYQTIRYAAKLGSGVDADIVLLYVRPIDQGLRSGGLQVRLARENMLEWGLELPGIKYLKKGFDILKEMGGPDEIWHEHSYHTNVEGDPLGDNKIEYINEAGKVIVLKLKVSTDIATGILEQWELGPYDLIILGASGRWRGMVKQMWDPAVAEKVAIHAQCSVLVARGIDVGHGHLICTDGSENAMDTVRKDAYLASRCECPVSLISVALDVESEDDAKTHVETARKELKKMEIDVENTHISVGNPVANIVEVGADYSVIVVSESSKKGFKRFFMGSVAFKVLQEAFTSVMVVR
jgi:nucleotide-binding universal stress UspA family protein